MVTPISKFVHLAVMMKEAIAGMKSERVASARSRRSIAPADGGRRAARELCRARLSERGVRSAQKTQVGPCVPEGIQR